MKNNVLQYLIIMLPYLFLLGCKDIHRTPTPLKINEKGQSVYIDLPYLQDYSIKYYFTDDQQNLNTPAISSNRDGQIRILSNNQVLVPDNGSILYPGGMIPDESYPQLLPKKIVSISTYKNQTAYLDDH